jgi:hypothetical protein
MDKTLRRYQRFEYCKEDLVLRQVASILDKSLLNNMYKIVRLT